MKYNPEIERVYMRGLEGPFTVPIPPEVLAIKYIEPTDAEIERGMPFETRASRAREITAATGFPIDVPVDVWGWGATNTHKLRRMYGYNSVPDATGSMYIMVA